MTSTLRLSAAIAAALAFGPAAVGAARAEISSPTVIEDYDGLTKGVAVTALTADGMFGDSTSLFDGATTFTATDVALKTNSALTVSIGRKLSNAGLSLNTWANTDPDKAVFGRYWVLDIPHIHGVFDRRTGWVVRDREYQGPDFPDSWRGSTQRCSVADYTPPTVPDNVSSGPTKTPSYGPTDYWAGNTINIPGMGEELLQTLSGSHSRPNDGLAYYGGTKSNWKVSCLPSIRNGAGEGFLAVLPNGHRYTFDWMVVRKSKRIVGIPTDTTGSVGIDRDEIFLYATRVEDGLGNWLSYEYDPANPHRLLSIRSNDGVEARLGYNAAGKIETISSAGRTWTYEYSKYGSNPDANYLLAGTVLPDGGRWGYQYSDQFEIVNANVRNVWQQCWPNVGTMSSDKEPGPAETSFLTVSHPSGAVGEFKFRKLMHGTNRTVGSCITRQEASWLSVRLVGAPMAYTVESLYSKTVTGPGIAPLSWNYRYKPSWSWQADCQVPGTCYVPSETTVVNPDGSVNAYKFNNDYKSNVGELIEASIKDAGGRVLRTLTNAYVESAEGQPFPASNANIPASNSISGSKGYLANRPLKTRQIVQDGVTFVTENQIFDGLARVLRSTGYNTLGYSRNEGTEYHDHTGKWILGQVSATSVNGVETARAEFDPTTALPVKAAQFGVPKAEFIYRADGTLATMKDGNGNITAFDNWKRGVPQAIRHPATPEFPSGTTENAVVDDRGWVISTVDENGFTTNYTYDGMGRLTKVTYPQEDAVDWHPTIQEFTRVPTPEYGLEGGHWRRVSTAGNRRSDTYYDAFLRPVLEMVFDLSDVSRNTQRQEFTRYDAMGRVSFRSFSTRHVADFRQPMPGSSYVYDALGRNVLTTQDSELGPLVTAVDYLVGFKRRTTNPRKFSSVETFQVFGEPTYKSPVVIDSPENVRTQIMRDAYGKPLEIRRGSIAP